MKWMKHWILVAAALSAGAAHAQILIGQTVGLTGPVAATDSPGNAAVLTWSTYT